MADTDEERRRAAKRQLNKWAKIMCQIVGLERVAEELMGRRTWMSYQDVMVGQETNSSEPLCATASRQPPLIATTREGSRSPMAGGWYMRPSSPEPQPLDLSAKPPKPPVSPNKAIFKAKPRPTAVGTRRSYTEDELQAALRDIQSGKLGTRRAAVIYGIPRSTLRNKVYKISQGPRDIAGIEERAEDEEDDDRDSEGAEEERETEKVLMRPLLSVEDVIRLTSEVRSWPCLQQLLGGASTSSEEPPLRVPNFRPVKNGEEPIPVPKDQPLDFRREVRNHNNNNSINNNNHLEEKKHSPGGGNKQQSGGKGTRPKRGKYRNYDRDSLVEAVRAVQRGEMSVHRAGSYYGVPHSTLEYKVKERHLMRPRKREPKPQPPEEKRKEEEKRVIVPPPPRPPRVTPPLANGLKMQMFDPTLAYRGPFPPYWQAPFPPILEFGRQELFAQQLSTAPLTKTTREIAESLLEAENGSFLDGIIRSSLDTGLPGQESGKVLMEQLCRPESSKPPPATTPATAPATSSPPANRTPSPNNC